jgi:hypothetical protein
MPAAGRLPYPADALPEELRAFAEYLQAARAEERRTPLYLMPYYVPGFSD